MTKPELLAPAGDWERLETALRFGADAVYLGGPRLHLRAAPTDFTMEQVARAAALCHSLGRKLYVTVNAYAREEDLAPLPRYAAELYDAGVDAALVSDLGVLSLLKQGEPRLPLHVSTQANCLNSAAARAWQALGASRIVLGREASLDEIRAIKKAIPQELELEVFVHGAMCMSYSGRCMLSNVLTGRDANRGGCAQPCRWRYRLEEEKRPGEYFPIEQDEAGTYVLSAWDLNLLPYLNELTQAGVASVKLEGRMKSPYYVATTVNAYRRALDGAADTETLLRELDCASHRAYSTGFLFGRDGARSGAPGYTQSCLFIGPVLAVADGRCVVEMRGRFGRGDVLEVLSPRALGQTVTVADLRDDLGAPIAEAIRTQQHVSFAFEGELQPGDILRRRL